MADSVSLLEKAPRISITGLRKDTSSPHNEYVSVAIPMHEFEREVQDRWAATFTEEYVREKILKADSLGENSCTLAKERIPYQLREQVCLRRAFYERIESHEFSIKEQIEALIDPLEIRVIRRHAKECKAEPIVKILLFWGRPALAMPSYCLEEPRVIKLTLIILGVVLGVIVFIRMLI